jgi:lipid-binding SYLF domain-containing protein
MSVSLGLILCCLFTACSTAPKSESEREQLIVDATQTLERFRRSNQTLSDRINNAHGYAVFPTIGKGGWFLGGAYGRGVVYEQDSAIGFTDMTQGSIGFQFGGQSYSELILFDHHALEEFKTGKFSLGAQASAVAATAGAGGNAAATPGVMIFTLGEAGLMGEASVGGQGFSFEPM